jgi:hypothetical protein
MRAATGSGCMLCPAQSTRLSQKPETPSQHLAAHRSTWQYAAVHSAHCSVHMVTATSCTCHLHVGHTSPCSHGSASPPPTCPPDHTVPPITCRLCSQPNTGPAPPVAHSPRNSTRSPAPLPPSASRLLCLEPCRTARFPRPTPALPGGAGDADASVAGPALLLALEQPAKH